MDPKYVIGIPEMDNQHAKLFELAAAAKQAPEDEFAMNAIVMELIKYVESHLDREEEFLKESGLHDFEKQHSKKHTVFRGEVMEFYDSFRDASELAEKAAILARVVTFCEKWLVQHIDVEDRAYADLLKNRS